MRFLLLTLGTRGDAEPFLTLGVLLRRAGHEVCIALAEQLVPLAEDAGLPHYAFDPDFLELLVGQTGRDVMGGKGSVLNRLRNLYRLFNRSKAVQRTLIRQQYEWIEAYAPERVITHPKCGYARAWGRRHPGRSLTASPVPNAQHPTADYPQIGIPVHLGRRGNLLSFAAINRLAASMSVRFLRALPDGVPEARLTAGELRRYFADSERWLYLISPTLFPPPPEWPTDRARIVGYFERPKASNWTPDEALLGFLDRFSERGITLITFGSMVNADPAATTREIVAALSDHDIPAILVTSSGGLVAPPDPPDHLHFLSSVPYDWLLPRVDSVVHHGGSGTTHTALRYGCPSLVIPHIIDQFFWNRRVAELGAGPRGMAVKKLRSAAFGRLLVDLRGNPTYRQRAGEIAERMAGEGGTEALLDYLCAPTDG